MTLAWSRVSFKIYITPGTDESAMCNDQFRLRNFKLTYPNGQDFAVSPVSTCYSRTCRNLNFNIEEELKAFHNYLSRIPEQ